MRKLLFVLMTAFASLDAGAQTFFTQGNLLFTVNGKNPTTVSVKKAFSDIGGEIVIPSTVVNEGVAYTVTLITGNAFDNTSITSVTIPASVDSIGNRAFESCQSLTNIHIDDSDKELKLVSGFYGILYGANADKSVYVGRNLILSENSAPFPNAISVEFGDKVTAINKRLFYDANKLANVTIGKGVTEIGDAAFWNAGDDESVVEMTVTLGENVKTIGVSAFESCDKLMSITLPEKLDTIFDSAFQTTGLTGITIPVSVDSIGNRAFADCSSLASIRIQESAVPLPLRNGFYGTFYGSDADKTVYIGRTLKLNEVNPIASNATSVEFGDQVTAINPRLFYDANKLANVTIGKGVTEIGDAAFWNAGDDESVVEMTVTLGENVKTIGVSAFESCDKLMSITLPEKLDTIFDSAFQTTGLTGITIPVSVDSIGNRAFADCSSLASIRIQESAVPLPLRNGFYGTFYGSDADKTVYIGRTLKLNEENPIASNAKSVEFGDLVTAINPRLFYDDNRLATLKIGSGVKTIGKAAFYGSGDDEDIAETIVTMGSNVTSIDNSAFESCRNMKSVTLPQTLTTIGELAFSNSGLTAISIPGAVTTIGSQAFGSTPLTSITLEDGDQPCAIVNGFYGTFRTPSADYDLYLGRNLVYEDQNGSPFPNVTSATIGSKVTSLPHRFFYDRDKLTAVTGAENVATMGTEVYKYCDNLESVELGSTLRVLPESTFESCVKLANLQLPSSLVEIQQWSIYNCQALAELTIPASVQSIGKTANGENGYHTFYQDKGMRRLVIADSDQPLLFADTYGVFFRDMNQLESLYLGRNIVTEGNANQPFTAAREIEFGKGVTDIGLQLSGVTAQTVKAPWQTPITINENAFNQATYSGATLWIPGGTKAAYAEATGWQKFLNVETASYVLAIEASHGGSLTVGEVTVSGGEKAEMLIEGGASVTFTMRADEGYELTALTVDGRTVQPEGDTYVIQSLMNDISVAATYAPITYQIAYNLAGGVADNPLTYNIETETFTLANPTREHYVFAGWTGTGLDKPAETVTIEKGSIGNREYTATWTPLDYAITYELDGGSVDNDAPKYGDTVVLTIMDDPDATLVSLTVNGVDVTAQVVNNQYVIERVEENIIVEAVFRSLYEYVRMTDRMATFSCPLDLNFTGSDVKAYIAAGYNKQEGEVLLVRVYDVPAGTGLVLKGDAGVTYKVPYSESQSYYVNLLKAQLTAGTVAPTEGEASNFLLRAEADDEFRFGIVEGETRLAGQQAYLQVPTSFVTPGTAYVKIIFADEDPDAVERFTITDEQSRDAIYNLGGIKMTKEHLRGGVYIVNGKKVKVK